MPESAFPACRRAAAPSLLPTRRSCRTCAAPPHLPRSLSRKHERSGTSSDPIGQPPKLSFFGRRHYGEDALHLGRQVGGSGGARGRRAPVACARAGRTPPSGRRSVDLVAHLAELDSRKLYRGEGYSSLSCTALLFSVSPEQGAYNRIEAARAARRFPIALELLADGSLNLATLRLLAPHLTTKNCEHLLDEAKGKSKRDVELIVARCAPGPMCRLRSGGCPPPRPDATMCRHLQVEAVDERRGHIAHSATAAPPLVEPPAAAQADVGLGEPTVVATAAPRRAIVEPLAPERFRLQSRSAGRRTTVCAACKTSCAARSRTATSPRSSNARWASCSWKPSGRSSRFRRDPVSRAVALSIPAPVTSRPRCSAKSGLAMAGSARSSRRMAGDAANARSWSSTIAGRGWSVVRLTSRTFLSGAGATTRGRPSSTSTAHLVANLPRGKLTLRRKSEVSRHELASRVPSRISRQYAASRPRRLTMRSARRVLLIAIPCGLAIGGPLVWPAHAQHYQTDFPAEEFKARWAAVIDAIGNEALAVVQGVSLTNGFQLPRQSNTLLLPVRHRDARLVPAARRPRPARSRCTCRRATSGWSAPRARCSRPKTRSSSKRLTGADDVKSTEAMARGLAARGRERRRSPRRAAARHLRGVRAGRGLCAEPRRAEGADAAVASDPWDGAPAARRRASSSCCASATRASTLRDLNPILDELRASRARARSRWCGAPRRSRASA